MNERPVRGLYAVTPERADTGWLARAVAAALAGGARIVQYRAKGLAREERIAQAQVLVNLCRSADALFIVNDSVEVALAVDADGVHLGRDDGDLAAARLALGAGKRVGASCYGDIGLAQEACRRGADHVAFGAAYPSPTKPGAARASVELFRDARQRLDVPIVAIGGITPENAPALVEAGVDAVAVVSSLFDAPDIEAQARRFAGLFDK